MIEILIYIVSLLSEALIFWYYASQIFKLKRSKKIEFLFITIGYSLLFSFSFIVLPGINVIAFVIVNFLLLYLLYDIKLGSCFFHTFILTSIMSFTEVAIFGLSNQFTTAALFDESNYIYMMIVAFSGKLLYFITARVIVAIMHGRKAENQYSGRAAIILNIIPFISFFMIVLIITVLLATGIPTSYRYMMSAVAILLLFINILIFFIYNYLGQKNAEYTSLKLQLQKEDDLEKYYMALSEQDEKQNILIHDIKKHLTTVASLNEQNDPDKIRVYLNDILNSPTLQSSLRMSGNDLLNAILCRYHDLFSTNGIKFITEIRKNKLEAIKYADLTALFCNLLDNAYNACLKNVDHANDPDSDNSPYVELRINDKDNSAITFINVINTCLTAPAFNKKGRPFSTKDGRHGIGIKSIERVINTYNGNYNMYYDDVKKEFHVIIGLRLG